MSEKELWVLVLQTLMLLCRKGPLDSIKDGWTDKLNAAATRIQDKGVLHP